MRQHSINGMGGRPRWRSAGPEVLSGREFARQAHPGRHVAGAGPLSGEGRTMRDPELVARARRAATRLESAWEQWRALHGLAVAPGQQVVSYVGYSLQEPWGEPRVVIGIDADEAEFLAEFLDRDECVQRVQIPQQQVRRAEPPAEGTGEHAPAALAGAPGSLGRHAPDPLRDMAHDQVRHRGNELVRDMGNELAGWSPGEFPPTVTDQFAAWPPVPQTGTDQPPAS